MSQVPRRPDVRSLLVRSLVLTGLLLAAASPAPAQEEADAAARLRQLLAGELRSGHVAGAAELIEAGGAGRSALRLADVAVLLLDVEADTRHALRAALPASSAAREALEPAFAALSARDEGEDELCLARCRALLASDELLRFATELGSREALRLARSGRDPGAVAFLESVVRRYDAPAWAQTNLGLALRLLGEYARSAAVYEEALAQHGRQAWLLNERALVALGRLDDVRAETLLREGAALADDPAGRGTCQGNLARVLMQRAERLEREQPDRAAELRQEAIVLLRAALAQDPSRTRSRYWLGRLTSP